MIANLKQEIKNIVILLQNNHNQLIVLHKSITNCTNSKPKEMQRK